jgi:hypothetical protein
MSRTMRTEAVNIVARIIPLRLVALQPLGLDQHLLSLRTIEKVSDRRSVEANGAVSRYLQVR